MRVLENKHGWNPIQTAPVEVDVMLEVTDGNGEPYRLRSPCRLTSSGWVSSTKGTTLVVIPVKWKLRAGPGNLDGRIGGVSA
jgi:hypothetical protein